MDLEKERLTVGHRPDGSEVSLPVVRVQGSSRGPRLLIALSVHGDEITGHKSVWYLLDYLRKATDLKGELTIISLVNVEGFNYSIRGFPYSTLDLNRMFPGDGRGSLPERITAKVWSLASKADFVLDVHTAGLCIPFVLIHPAEPLIRDFMEDVAYASGLTPLYNYDPELYDRIGLGRSLSGTSVRNGTPALTLELPGFVGIDQLGARAGFIALKNVMVKLGMLDGDYEEVDFLPVIRRRGMKRVKVSAGSAGLLDYTVELGEEVFKGQLLAKVRDPFGDVLEEVRAPEDGFVVQINGFYRTFTGGKVATLAVETGG